MANNQYLPLNIPDKNLYTRLNCLVTFIKENEMKMLLAKTRLNVVITDIFYSIVLKSPTIFKNILTFEMVMSKYVKLYTSCNLSCILIF